jgi:hypothetical protein
VSENLFARNLVEEIFPWLHEGWRRTAARILNSSQNRRGLPEAFRNRPASETLSELNRSGKIDYLKNCFLACTT